MYTTGSPDSSRATRPLTPWRTLNQTPFPSRTSPGRPPARHRTAPTRRPRPWPARSSRPAAAGAPPAAAASAQGPQLALVPDGQERLAVAVQEANLALPAAPVDAAPRA